MFIYNFYDKNDNLIYIGKTINSVKSRIQSHFGGFKSHKKSKYLWQNKVKYYNFASVNNKSMLAIYEVYLINKFKPKYNYKDNYNGEVTISLPSLDFSKKRNVKEMVTGYNKLCDKIKEKRMKLKENENKTTIIDTSNFYI